MSTDIREHARASSSVNAEVDQIVGADAAKQKGEIISPLSDLPSDFDFVVTQTEENKVKYIREILARSEDEAIKVVAPAIRMYKTATDVVTAYLPLIRVLKEHYCQKGRPKTNPATKKRNRTWGDVCTQSFGISLRRMQQILALDGQEKLPSVSAAQSKTKIDRRAYERAVKVAEPAAKLSQAVVAEGLSSKFPEAIDILKLANVPVPVVKSAPLVPEQPQTPTSRLPLPKSGDSIGLVSNVSSMCGEHLKAALKGLEPEVMTNVFGRFVRRLAQLYCHDRSGGALEMNVAVEYVGRKPPTSEKENPAKAQVI